MVAKSGPSVCVLLALHNGAQYLSQQLESLRAQSLPPTHVIVGDDGSTDASVDILQEFFNAWPEVNVRIVPGPQTGYADNFLKLFRCLPREIDYVALCDQDDVWLPDKLERAVSTLRKHTYSNGPLLYGSATLVCDENLENSRPSKSMMTDLKFSHALVENFAGGNTMVLNAPAAALLRRAASEDPPLLVHDWWMYQMITGAGGHAIYDENPSMLYRQHSGNVIGDNKGFKSQADRLKRVWRGDYRRWTDANLLVLHQLSHFLTAENAKIVEQISRSRRQNIRQRAKIIPLHGLRRHKSLGQFALWLAVLSKRF